MTGRCLFVNTYYGAFLESHYSRNPALARAPYREQLQSLNGECFGDSDFYSSGLKRAGWEASDIIINCAPLQAAWARENGVSATGFDLVIEQIRAHSPDVVYLQDLSCATRPFLERIRDLVPIIAGQIASVLPDSAHLPGLDLIFTSFPHYVERFRARGVAAYYQALAFDPRILERLGSTDRSLELTFVGGISGLHSRATSLLEHLARETPIRFWGYGRERLPDTSQIQKSHGGEAWGLDMFSLLAASKLTVNRHVDSAENFANNMRLFEATGCGALLITDHKDNLDDLFEIGKEVVAYRSAEECVALIEYFQRHPERARDIARAGQARTLRDHTYGQRMQDTARILGQHLRRHRDAARLSGATITPSADYRSTDDRSEIPDLTEAWKDPGIPLAQRALVNRELQAMYRGHPPRVYTTLCEALGPLLEKGTRILEIGCASGYYFEALEYLLGRRLDYTGVDYSGAMIEMASEYYPDSRFIRADGASMPFRDAEFDISVSSCVLLHVQDVDAHVKETARVSSGHVIAHRTPVCRSGETRSFTKKAYGVECLENMFNEDEFISIFARHGLEMTNAIELESDSANDRHIFTYLFKKTGHGDMK
ncbi:MAG: glycosyltransferase [bacterium]|nr:glycosyltransferase [bacterium]